MLLILKWLIMTVSVMVTAYVIPGVTVRNFMSALWVALLLGIVNMLLRPFLILITLPINILTLGLFTFVINGLIILLVSSVVKGFQVSGFWIAVLFSIVLSIVNYVMNFFIGTR
ncbi:MAG TPA: phage holin family protein [Syntrophorhabdus sp.]|nr:phage holin family protein [Syntrophorhabdus sp.]HNS78604.1 phage holin family protein [Syntrophorhabdus sp.]HNY69975.1 phage holin family protein [Syntrophorhabdus sp.]HQB34602.1 phage holin family protein [Syntrophorhabdus sp.]